MPTNPQTSYAIMYVYMYVPGFTETINKDVDDVQQRCQTHKEYWSPQRNKTDLTHKELLKRLCQDLVLIMILKLKLNPALSRLRRCP
jgi:hypothetical protein